MTDILSRIDDTLTALLDNSIDDELSDDAMRWTPNLPPGFRDPPFSLGSWSPPVMLDVGLDLLVTDCAVSALMTGAFIERLGVDLAPWQEVLIRCVDEAFKAAAPAFARVSASFAALEPVLRDVEAARRARLRRIHHLYRQRRRRW